MNEENYQLLLKELKETASRRHCYERNRGEYAYPEHKWDVFEDGADYGEILLARTVLEVLGVEFDYPCMKEPSTAMTEKDELLQSYQREIEQCYNIAQKLDTLYPELPSSFTGTPSERIRRHLTALGVLRVAECPEKSDFRIPEEILALRRKE